MAVMRNIQPSFAGGELSPALYGRVDNAKYAVGLRTCLNFYVHAHGGASNRPGFEFVGEVKDSTRAARLIAFQFNTTQTYVLEFGHQVMRVIKDGGYVLDSGTGLTYEIATPYGEDDLPDLNYTQSADVMYLVHPSHPPCALSRTGHDAWALDVLAFEPEIAAPGGVSASYSGSASPTTTLKYVVTAIDGATGDESLPSTAATVTGPTESSWPAGDTVSVSWAAVGGAARYRIYKDDNGILGYIGATAGTDFEDDNIVPDVAQAAPEARNPFEGPGNYPSVVEFFEQRLLFAATDNQPQTVWASRTGAYRNFSTATPTREDDAITVTVAARQVNRIRHMVPLTSMILLTSGGEWRLAGGDGSEPLTPTSVTIKPQGFRGSANVRPLVIGGEVLHVQAMGAAVRSLSYSLEVDGYVGNNLSVLAAHLFAGHTITDWAYQQEPDSIIWCVRDDGVLLSFTYLKEHEVYAWARHTTAGAFEAIAVVPEDDEDAVYVVVRRTINGLTKRYVERLHTRRFAAVEDAFFVDSGLTYGGVPASTFSGLDHLEGEEVAILADGNVLPRQTVSGGQITLPRQYAKVHVGLPYTADLETMNLDLGVLKGLGSVQGRRKSVPQLTVRVRDSRSFKAGAEFSAEMDRTAMQIDTWGSAPTLVSDDITVTLPAHWNSHGRVCIRQDEPVPLTVLAVMPDMVVGS